jgi:hypothetical protein
VNGWRSPSAVRTCEILCNIFVLLGNSGNALKSECHVCYNSIDHANGSKAKDFLIEALTFLEPDIIHLALDRLQKDVKVHFVVKLEDGEYLTVPKKNGA